MPTITLDATTVRTTICPAGQRKLDLYDTQTPGLVLEIRPSGGKTYYLRYRDAHGKQRQHAGQTHERRGSSQAGAPCEECPKRECANVLTHTQCRITRYPLLRPVHLLRGVDQRRQDHGRHRGRERHA